MCEPPARRVNFALSIDELVVMASSMGAFQGNLVAIVMSDPRLMLAFGRADEILKPLVIENAERLGIIDVNGTTMSFNDDAIEALDDEQAAEQAFVIEDACPGDLAALGTVLIAAKALRPLADGDPDLRRPHMGTVQQRLIVRIGFATMYADELLYSEPDSGLDPIHRENVWRKSNEQCPDANGERMWDAETGAVALGRSLEDAAIEAPEPHFLSQLPDVQILDLGPDAA